MVLAALKEHQKVAVSWMNNQEKSSAKGSILGDDMGLGKTGLLRLYCIECTQQFHCNVICI